MPDAPQPHARLTIFINDQPVVVAPGTLVAAALLNVGTACRHSVTGEPRTAVCGMGICFECRASIDGVAHRRTCQLVCAPGMQVLTT